MNIAMIENRLPKSFSENDSSSFAQPQSQSVSKTSRNVSHAQQIIYDYLLSVVKVASPEDVLEEFKHLFVHHANTASSELLPALYEIVFANNEQEFRNTLKRSCYILINNWDISRNHKSIQKLVQLFSDRIIYKPTQAPTLKRLRGWIKNFVNSKDYEELKLFASRYDKTAELHWSDRYTSYLLVPQYINLENSVEQREAARALSKKLKQEFKFDLAFFTALSESLRIPQKEVKNPTHLGEESLRLIKTVIARRGQFNNIHLANIFRQQIQNLRYKQFKKSLSQYLIYSFSKDTFVQTLEKQISEKLEHLYDTYDEKLVTDALVLRTSNRVVEFLTTEDHETPSPLFTMLLSQGSPLTLVIVLVKIVLMCRHVLTHLEARIADLIRYYEKYSEDDCQWVVTFFEIFHVVMTIHVESTEFTLVNMNHDIQSKDFDSDLINTQSLDQYRIFSQQRLIGEFDENIDPEIEQAINLLINDDLDSDDIEKNDNLTF